MNRASVAVAETHVVMSTPSAEAAYQSVQVTRFGEEEAVTVKTADVLTFPDGVIGMEHLRSFVLIDDPRITTCRWLQSLDDVDTAFVVVQPHLVLPDYVAEVSDADAAQLDLQRAEDAEVWAIVSLGDETEGASVNLLAPVIISRRSRRGKQLILDGSTYAIRHPLTPSDASGE